MEQADGGGASRMTLKQFQLGSSLNGESERKRSGIRHIRILSAAVLVGSVLVGCSPEDGRLFPNSVDLVRAQAAWQDPWLAPTTTTTAKYAGTTWVNRLVGSREYWIAESAFAAVNGEVEQALSGGWSLVGAVCPEGVSVDQGSPDGSGSDVAPTFDELKDPSVTGEVVAVLARGGSDLDRAQLARVVGTDGEMTRVVVSVQVPHHQDRAWPDDPPLEVSQTCLGGGPSMVIEELPNQPWGGVTGDPRRPVYWSEAEPSQDLLDVVAKANADPMLIRLGVVLSEPHWIDDKQYHDLPYGAVSVSWELDEVVARAVDKGWELTFTSCRGPVQAELRRGVSGDFETVLRVTEVVSGEPLQVFAVLSSPQWGGPVPGELDEVSDICWQDPAVGVSGRPWFGPTEIAPPQPD